MPDFWLDADSLIAPHRGPYRFAVVPQFWEFLAQKAKEDTIASPQMVLDELPQNDELGIWARQAAITMFRPPTDAVQAIVRQVADYVQGNPDYRRHWVVRFLAGADPWVIAHAKASNARVVTFEIRQPQARKPKIPDVAAHFNVHCLSIYDMLSELKWCSRP
jgi:hypothetical protein